MKKWCNGAGERQFGRLMPQVLGCLNLRWCPKSQAGWRAAGLDPFVSTASRNKGVLVIRNTLLPGLGGREHPNLHQFQAKLNILPLVAAGVVEGSCRFVRCREAAPLTSLCAKKILPSARSPPEEAVEDLGMSCSSQGACCPAHPCLAASSS